MVVRAARKVADSYTDEDNAELPTLTPQDSLSSVTSGSESKPMFPSIVNAEIKYKKASVFLAYI